MGKKAKTTKVVTRKTTGEEKIAEVATEEKADPNALIIPDTPNLTSSKTLFKIVGDNLIGIDGKKTDPQLTLKGTRQFLNSEQKRLHNERRNVIYFVKINGVDARLNRSQWLKVLSGIEDPANENYILFSDGISITLDRDPNDEPTKKTTVRLVINI